MFHNLTTVAFHNDIMEYCKPFIKTIEDNNDLHLLYYLATLIGKD